MLIRHALFSLLCVAAISPTWAITTAPAVAQAPAAPASTSPSTAVQTPSGSGIKPATPTAPLRQESTLAPASVPAMITAMQQKHKLELAQQEKRLALLEQANQTALAQNQALQLKNDNLTVQVQVLQSERSAQMFIYGAVTFGSGVFVGVLLYGILYTRRRRQW